MLVEVVHDRGDVDAADAVDERVVRLAQHRPLAIAKALDHPDLPQRPVAVEALREHAPCEPAELLVAAGMRQGGVAQVVPEVEVRVVDPDGPSLLCRDLRDALAIAGHEVEPLST
ncbi:hypothetical protein LRS13_16905 [Svornostia abyssi]|uniref:Uncharacterized protein n=1 Tax=Svornostia abyssi TaxID=2898438 RepID=A0ABY5PCG3_9ACTN|nr:hypothetical protein LRS13_16905 [Parviterribacteraceae bacterium J379]